MVTRSYVKIYGPPLLKAIKELEKVAIDVPEVCIMDTIIEGSMPAYESPDFHTGALNYFTPLGKITKERCSKIISKSGEMLGEHDFFFEWFKDPSQTELNNLIEKIDKAIAPLGCKYTITTKK